MFELIYEFFAVVFGYITHGLYIALDFVHLPYLWLCIVVLAAITRLISLPSYIGNARKEILAPAINYDLNKVRDKYRPLDKKDVDKVNSYKKETQAVFKKHGVSSGSGFLTLLIQLPIFIGLFRVINDPFKYVPALGALTEVQRAGIKDFFGLSLDMTPSELGTAGLIVVLCVLISTNISQIISLFKKFRVGTIISIVFISLLMGWMSYKLPLVISLYWATGHIATLVIKIIISRSVKNNADVKRVLADTALKVAFDKEQKTSQVLNASSN